MKFQYSALCLCVIISLKATITQPPDGVCGPKSLLELPQPLFSLGQNIIDKNELFFGPLFYANYWERDEVLNLMPCALYGVTDTLCLTCFMPLLTNVVDGNKVGNGWGDIIPGFEWAFVHNKKGESLTQATVFTQIKIPVSDNKPILTTGNVDILVGGTLAYNTHTSYMFTSGGILCPTTHENFRKGYQFFYEAGIGPILHKTDHSILSLFIECNGIYTTSDVNNPYPFDLKRNNNVVYVGPVLYWGYENMLIQVGAQGVLTQHFEQESDQRKPRIGMQFFFVF